VPETVDRIREHRPQAQVNFIQKPFMPQALAVKVREVLDDRR
jgi:DNA-binding NtrC family response regulator